MSQPGYEWSEEQILEERAASQVSDVLLNLERLRKRFTQDTYCAVDTRLI